MPCLAYVPEEYHPEVPYGVVVWLHAPGQYKPDELVELWKPLCDEHDFICLPPSRAIRPCGVRPTCGSCAACWMRSSSLPG